MEFGTHPAKGLSLPLAETDSRQTPTSGLLSHAFCFSFSLLLPLSILTAPPAAPNPLYSSEITNPAFPTCSLSFQVTAQTRHSLHSMCLFRQNTWQQILSKMQVCSSELNFCTDRPTWWSTCRPSHLYGPNSRLADSREARRAGQASRYSWFITMC